MISHLSVELSCPRLEYIDVEDRKKYPPQRSRPGEIIDSLVKYWSSLNGRRLLQQLGVAAYQTSLTYVTLVFNHTHIS